MTSKEALNKIQHNFGQLKGQELINCFETIEKDLQELERYRKVMTTPIQEIIKKLEVLEILKKHIKLEPVLGMGTEIYKDVEMNIIAEDDDNYKVIRWLENE